MKNIAAVRYAKALYDSAASDGTVDLIRQELGSFVSVLDVNPKLKTVLFQNRVSLEEKKALIQDVFADRYCPRMIEFLTLLIERKRVDIVSDIYVAYCEIVQASENTITAHVKTARALTHEQEEDLREKLVSVTGSNVRLVTEIDTSLIGGMSVRLGDKLIDGSIRGYVERLGRHIGARQIS